MDTDYDTLAEKVAEYIGVVQPRLERLDALEKSAKEASASKAGFVKRATETINNLCEEGLVSKNDVNKLVDRVSEDPSSAWDLVEKLASAIQPPSVGGRSEVTASVAPQDPWEREFGGYGNSADNGMID